MPNGGAEWLFFMGALALWLLPSFLRPTSRIWPFSWPAIEGKATVAVWLSKSLHILQWPCRRTASGWINSRKGTPLEVIQ
jgi:hypothetical protein